MSRIYLNDQWKFAGKYTEDMIKADYDEQGMQDVRLPHTCKEVPFHYFDEHLYQMLCVYRRKIYADKEWKNKAVILTIDGAAHSAEVFLNGSKIGEHHCGYTAFSIDISDKLNYNEENIIAICVNSKENQNIPPFGFVIDYMTYGGIYRDVYLDIHEKEYIEDIFVRTELPADLISKPEGEEERYLAHIISEVKIKSEWIDSLEKEPLYIRQKLMKQNKKSSKQILITDELMSEEEEIPLSETMVSDSLVELDEQVNDILLWELDNPCLYNLKTELVRAGEVIDERTDTFGFRKAEFRKDGFYLNGNKIKIRGLNRHQSYPYVGYAMPESMQKQDADILKYELGCNAVRTSHYPQSHYFVERCDEIGLLVFMEIPGWQHIGDELWKQQAITNVKEMILQYRNHTSIILWGVRINESIDDDEFYKQTNAVAHVLDHSRPTGGVRAHKKSNLLEDVYTYNDFSHDGKTPGCEAKKKVTSDRNKPYLISEFNGHMFPTKAFDWEEHRVEHALRHANVLNDVASHDDIAGCFGWCMFDYNTHKDFGSGDRICYHGVMDMFRNPKLAAYVYACEQEHDVVLELSSSMDIGEHPGCNRGTTYIISNADSVKMYKNDRFIKEYTNEDSPFQNLKHGPMIIDDFIGNEIEERENFTKKQAKEWKYILNYVARNGYGHYPVKILWIALKSMVLYHMKPIDSVKLYNKYIGDWGGTSTVYRFEAIKNGNVIKTITKKPMTSIQLKTEVSSYELMERHTYDVAEVRVCVCDENENQLYLYQEPVIIETEGPIEVIGPKMVPVRGGYTGIYVKTIGKGGKAVLKLSCLGAETVKIHFNINV